MTTTTSTRPAGRTHGLSEQVGAGAAGGLVGGIVMGAMMHAGGVLPMVASLVGGDGVALGWVVHLAISVTLGVGYAVLLLGRHPRLATGAGLGAVYGGIWWVLGPLLLMPAALGMPVFQVNPMTLDSLLSHVVFGVLLGLVHAALRHRGVR